MAMQKCRVCGQEVTAPVSHCLHCGAELKKGGFERGASVQAETLLSLPLLIGSAGAIVLALGVFLPFVQMPMLGSINYFMDGEIGGWIVLAFAGGAIVSFLIRKYSTAGMFGMIAGGYIGWDVWDVMNSHGYIETELKDDPFRDMVQSMASTLEFEYGVYVLFGGVALILIGAFWGNYKFEQDKKSLVRVATPSKDEPPAEPHTP